MAQKYGKTWWGEQWLDALTNIDFSNRLPRGRTYANKGLVKKITIDSGNIKALVSGSRSRPYKVSFSVPQFTQSEKKKLMNAVTDNPLILSTLLNGELPAALNKVAQANKIKIFPSSWKDLTMDCSCPDWAVPCKHLAATVYKLTNEIDLNPFQIFSLHGLDILDELTLQGFVAEDTELEIPSPQKRMLDRVEVEANSLEDVDIEMFDFSTLFGLSQVLLSFLDDETIFFNGNFKTILKRAYKQSSTFANRLMKADTEEDTDHNFEQYTDVELIVSNEVFYFDTVLYGSDVEKHFGKRSGGIGELIQFLDSIPAKMVSRLSRPLMVMHLTYRFALKLLGNGAIIPEMLQLNNGHYTIRWIPAQMNAEVGKLFDALCSIAPPDMVQIMDMAVELKYYERREQVKVLCSLFLDHWMNLASSDFSANNLMIVERMFFSPFTYSFDKLGETEIPQSIYRWLSKFYIHHKQYIPVIRVDDEAEEDLFLVDILIENTADALQEPIPLDAFMVEPEYKFDRISVLKDLSLLASSFPEVESIISSSGTEILEFNSAEFTDVLLKILPVIELYGVRILLPKALKNLVRPQSSLKLQQGKDNKDGMSFLSLADMLSFDWQVAIGDNTMEPEEFFKMVENLTGIVRIKDQYMLIDEAEIEKLRKNLEQPVDLKPNELVQTLLTEEYERAKISLSKGARKLLDEFLNIKEVSLPEGLQADLRPYQQRGYEWMYKNLNMGIGSIIAGDMGLGKTIQVITLLLKKKQEGLLDKEKAIIIVPTSLLTNWEKEVEKFAPDLSTSVYHGSNREFDAKAADLIITTYGVLRSDSKLLHKPKWACLVIDEAQNIKNPSTAQTKAVKKVKSNIRIAMSGTPVENRLSEYWSIFDFTNKGYLGGVKGFKKDFATPIEKDHNKEALKNFRKVTDPFILRRLKTDKKIISDLPDKVENDRFAALTNEQAAIYQSVTREMMKAIDDVDTDEKGGSIQRQGMVLKLMIALKQICNHPRQYLKKGKTDVELSGKTQLLLQLLENIYESGEKVLIFTQFKEMGVMLEKLIVEHFNTKVMFLHGGTSRKMRDQMVDQFQNQSSFKTFVLSIKAAGTGLNLTAANNVIHFDLWWNPAVEQQATDRAYRIGQQKNVMVYRLITKNTFEERINEMIQAKKELADMAVATGEKWIGDLSNNELKELVKL